MWDDRNNKDKLRPETVTVILLADGTQKDTTETSAADNWSWSFENLPKYIYTVHDDGSVTKTEIVYTVDESAVPHYKKAITKNSD